MAAQRKAYRLQLSLPTAFIVLVLGGISLLVSFYMGMVTGQSMRQLPDTETVIDERGLPDAPDLSKEELKFFRLSEEKADQIELDLPRLDRLQQRTEELNSAAQSLNDEPRPTDLLKPPPVVADTEEAAPEGEDVVGTDDQARLTESSASYTVQVFSSKLRKNAEEVLNQLRDQGFPDAYIHTHINPDNSVLYRVRVGKVPKEQAEDRAFELRRLNFIDSVQITRI